MVFLCLAVNLLKISYRTYFASSLLWLPVALWQFRHTDRSLNISVQAPVTATQNVAAYRGEGVGGGSLGCSTPSTEIPKAPPKSCQTQPDYEKC